jgi:hypothetical protein
MNALSNEPILFLQGWSSINLDLLVEAVVSEKVEVTGYFLPM